MISKQVIAPKSDETYRPTKFANRLKSLLTYYVNDREAIILMIC